VQRWHNGPGVTQRDSFENWPTQLWHGASTFRTALHPTLALGALFPLIVFTIVVNTAIGLLSVVLLIGPPHTDLDPLAHDVIIKRQVRRTPTPPLHQVGPALAATSCLRAPLLTRERQRCNMSAIAAPGRCDAARARFGFGLCMPRLLWRRGRALGSSHHRKCKNIVMINSLAACARRHAHAGLCRSSTGWLRCLCCACAAVRQAGLPPRPVLARRTPQCGAVASGC
jgi:hypothetical protein